MTTSLDETDDPVSPNAPAWWVICLCAEWCNTCGEYRNTFDELASQWPGIRFEWLDIEEESEVVGDFDVETFPTLLVADGEFVRFLGTLTPQFAVLNRLISSLRTSAVGREPLISEDARSLFIRIRESRMF